MAVTPAIIATALGLAAPTSIQEAQWTLWIGDATRAIERRAEKVGVDVGTLNAEDVDYVVREAVVAHVNNPDNATQVAVSIDDGSVSRSYRSSNGRVTILDEWWALLGLTLPDGASVGSIRLYGEPDTSPVESWA